MLKQRKRDCANILGFDEGVFVDGLNDVFEKDLRRQCVAVVDNGLTILAIPAVHCGIREKKKIKKH